MDHAIIRPSQSLVKGGGPAAQFRLSDGPSGSWPWARECDGYVVWFQTPRDAGERINPGKRRTLQRSCQALGPTAPI